MKTFFAYGAILTGCALVTELVLAAPTLAPHPPAETFHFVGIAILATFALFIIFMIAARVWPGKLP